MKILLFGDAHYCKRSSIVTEFGVKYSLRLENQIKTFDWIKETAILKGCGMVIGLGDLFNSSQLGDMEITAARELSFAELPTYFLVGNHESSVKSLEFNSTKLLEAPGRTVIHSPQSLIVDNTELCFLPYILESERKPLSEVFPKPAPGVRRVILSHNDIKGINYGPVVSIMGFEIPDIEANCDLYINAHIHNGQKLTNKVYNIGNLTGQNFSEDAFKYSHNIMILDTDTLSIETIENPHALNFYKLDILNEQDLELLTKLKPNAVLSIRCAESLLEATRQRMATQSFIATRLITIPEFSETSGDAPPMEFVQVDHLAKFIECCRERLDNNEILEQELLEICK